MTAVTALDGRVWSSGGRGRDARLREWSMSGALHADVDLSTAGAGVWMSCKQQANLVALVNIEDGDPCLMPGVSLETRMYWLQRSHGLLMYGGVPVSFQHCRRSSGAGCGAIG